ncbi:MAG: hypothetical protein ACFB6R_02465 [Alphaproteobacteria bacterium]
MTTNRVDLSPQVSGAPHPVLSPEDSARLQELLVIADREKARAEEIGADLVARNPDHPDVHIAYARARSQRQDYVTAARHLDIAACLSDAPMTRFNLGYCHRQLGDYERAAAHLRRGFAMPGGQVINLAALLSNTLDVLGRRDEARAVLTAMHGRMAAGEKPILNLLDVFQSVDGDFRRVAPDLRQRMRAFFAGRKDAVAAAVLFWMKYDCHAFGRLDDKGALARLLRRASRAGAADIGQFWPESFGLPQDTDLALAAVGHGPARSWIFKPGDFSGGQGIEVLTGEQALARARSGTARGILQHYVDPPFTVEGRKINLRLLLCLPYHDRPEGYLWRDGLVTISPAPYAAPEDGGDTRPHVVNLLTFDTPDVMRPVGPFPCHIAPLKSLLAAPDPGRCLRDLPDRLAALARGLIDALEAAGFFDEIRALPNPTAFLPRFVGLDVGLDAEGRPWLFEVERFPGMGGVTEASAAINAAFRADWIDFILAPDPVEHPAFVKL